jgi:uncharacterized membrane protein
MASWGKTGTFGGIGSLRFRARNDLSGRVSVLIGLTTFFSCSHLFEVTVLTTIGSSRRNIAQSGFIEAMAVRKGGTQF